MMRVIQKSRDNMTDILNSRFALEHTYDTCSKESNTLSLHVITTLSFLSSSISLTAHVVKEGFTLKVIGAGIESSSSILLEPFSSSCSLSSFEDKISRSSSLYSISTYELK